MSDDDCLFGGDNERDPPINDNDKKRQMKH